jgi:hypothetical protein
VLQNLKSLRVSLQASLLVCFSLFSSFSETVNSVDALPQPEKVLLLKQTTYANGPVSTYVSKDAVKVCFTTLHGHLIAKAPMWRVAVVNDDDKSSYEVDYDTWLKHRIARTHINSDNAEPGNQMSLLQVSAAKYAGKTCRQYIFDAYPCKAKFFGLSRKDVADEKGCLILEKWFATPFVDSLPLAFRYFDTRGNFLSDRTEKEKLTSSIFGSYVDPLQCKSIELVDCPKDFFSYPKGYKKLNNEMAVFTSSRQKDMVEDLFHEGIMQEK